MAAGRTEITVALIGVSGVIAAALIANADKVFGPRTEASRPADGGSSGAALPGPTPSGPAAAEAATVPDIAGWWIDADGYRFEFVQDGANYRFVQYLGERQVGSGFGSLSGRDFSHQFQAEQVGSGRCTGSVSADGETSSGRCRAGEGNEWAFIVRRARPGV